jgi:hypothetical protein
MIIEKEEKEKNAKKEKNKKKRSPPGCAYLKKHYY